MAKPRIPTKPTELRDQLAKASQGIDGESSWPSTAPSKADVDAELDTLSTEITTVDTAAARLRQSRADLRTSRDRGVDIMKQIDHVTDGLYGPDAEAKLLFGLPPKKSTHGESHPLEIVLITKIEDGVTPAAIYVDWATEEGAGAYQIEWYTDPAMTQMVGAAAGSQSEYEIAGLVPGQQYWIRVRAVRGDEVGHWSDVATRVANL